MRRVATILVSAALLACSGDRPTNSVAVASVTISEPQTTTVTVGSSLQLSAIARDAEGQALSGRTITWSAQPTSVATVSASGGLVTAVSPGQVTVTATSEGRSTQISITISAAGAPQITGITPAVMTPGANNVVILGQNFGTSTTGNVVTVGGVAVNVVQASATQLTIMLPNAAALGCRPTGPVAVQVVANGQSASFNHPLQVAQSQSLAAGQLVHVEQSQPCVELPAAAGRYFMTVANPNTEQVFETVLNSEFAFDMVLTGATGAAVARSSVPHSAMRTSPPAPRTPAEAAIHRSAQAHVKLLEENRRIARAGRLAGGGRATGAMRAGPPGGTPPVAVSHSIIPPTTTLGQSHPGLRVPNINNLGLCTGFFEITARTVYVGTRTIIVEDVDNIVQGPAMNAEYQRIGEEFDNVMWPILSDNFGNALAYDQTIGGAGKVVMVFSQKVNNQQRAFGFVVTCDLLRRAATPPTQSQAFPSSNEGAYFYAFAPSSSDAGFGDPSGNPLLPSGGTVMNWRRIIRATVIHEVKHVLSYAERFSRGLIDLEETWLEEGTAMVAEELYGRTIYTTAAWPRGDATYQQTIFCDRRPTVAQCNESPFLMAYAFHYLYTYFQDSDNLTMLGAQEPSDGTWYGAGWSFPRWVIDQHYTAGNDGAFLKPLTQEPALTGVRNIEARAGRTYRAMLAEWSLANALDNRPSTTLAPGTRLSHPSWNTRDIFAGLNADLPSTYPSTFPVKVRQLGFGTSTTSLPLLEAGTAALFELGGTPAGAQLIHVRAVGPRAGDLRLSIVRVQ